MKGSFLPTIEQYFCDLNDPRIDRTRLHKLLEFVVIELSENEDLDAQAQEWIQFLQSNPQ